MAKSTTLKPSWLQATAVRVTRVHFVYVLAYMVSIVVFDSWNLLTHAAVSTRWTAAVILLVFNTLLWYCARIRFSNNSIYFLLVLVLISADIIFAAFNVYWERGLASKAVALFGVPLICAATLRSRSTLLATTILSSGAYSVAAVRYFYLHYGESYRVELYGYLFFYCALFFIMSWLLWIVINPVQNKL
jgi:hypothetical protein